MNMIKRSLLFLSVSTCTWATTTPNISDVILETKEINQIPTSKKPLIQLNEQKTAPQALSDQSNKRIFIKNFNIQGNSKLSTKKLTSLIDSYTNQALSFNQIQTITRLLTKAYKDAGYFVARAYIPKQKLIDDILTIRILEGTYGQFELNNQSIVKDIHINAILNQSKNNVISQKSFENMMLHINDYAGIIIDDASIKPGEQTGSSDFYIQTKTNKKYEGFILLDNHGNRYTGYHRFLGLLTINSPFRRGDKLSLYSLASQEGNLKFFNIDYERPISSNGLKAQLGYSYINYKLYKEYEHLNASGSSKSIQAKLLYPIIRSNQQNLYVSLQLEHQQLADKIQSNNSFIEKEINVATLQFNYDHTFNLLRKSNILNTSFNINYGNVSFMQDDDINLDKDGANTQGNYSKAAFDLSHLFYFSPKLLLKTTFKYQHALGNKNLDGSEDFSIGGVNAVKVYPVGEFSEENGYVVGIELIYNLPKIQAYTHTISWFYDWAKAYSNNALNSAFEEKSIQDTGIGYTFSYKQLFATTYLAWKLNSDEIESEPRYNTKFVFQLGATF